MSLPDYLLEPDDEPCEECGASWHTTRNCPVRHAQAAVERAENMTEVDRAD